MIQFKIVFRIKSGAFHVLPGVIGSMRSIMHIRVLPICVKRAYGNILFRKVRKNALKRHEQIHNVQAKNILVSKFHIKQDSIRSLLKYAPYCLLFTELECSLLRRVPRVFKLECIPADIFVTVINKFFPSFGRTIFVVDEQHCFSQFSHGCITCFFMLTRFLHFLVVPRHYLIFTPPLVVV